MTTQHIDNNTFKQFQAGDPAAFQQVYDLFFGLVLYTVKQFPLNEDECLDIVQESFIKLYRSTGEFDHPGAVKHWLIVTARNTALDQMRKQKVRHQYVQQQGPLAQHGDDDYLQSALHELEVSLVGRLIDEVVEESRDETFRLYYRRGMSALEIAEQQGVAVSTVTNRLSRLRNKFKHVFERHLQALRDSIT